jgi:LmbE family N-acetylglucosaminyl deacetylase
MSEAPSVVAVGAHQDDVEIHCAGTLLRYLREENATITTVTISDGGLGFGHEPSRQKQEVSEIRDAEAAACAKAMGGQHFGLRAGEDGTLTYSREAVARLTDVLRRVGATLLLAPPPDDYNEDHNVASYVADQAAIMASAPAFETEHPPLAITPRVLYMDAVGGFGAQPTIYIDISDLIDEKAAVLSLYESQMENMASSRGWDLIDRTQKLDAHRGAQAGVRYAEAFRPAMQWPRIHCERHLP